MAYKRQISYMDLIENELKRGNAGFVKWEKYDECHILSVFVNGVEEAYSKEADVQLSNGHSIGRLKIQNGRAEGTYLLTKGEKDWVDEIEMLRIPLGRESVLVAEFERPEISKLSETVEKESGTSDTEDVIPSQSIVEKSVEVPSEETQIPEADLQTEVSETTEETQENREEKSFWDILSETHELFYPFGNNTGCYRIFPKDINLLHGNYHPLQNNQFLMHGYYNYRHLIVFPKKDSDNEFWLGVPGIYHEREKMAARMYGFEKYEGTKKEYRAGDLGYYLITVEG